MDTVLPNTCFILPTHNLCPVPLPHYFGLICNPYPVNTIYTIYTIYSLTYVLHQSINRLISNSIRMSMRTPYLPSYIPNIYPEPLLLRKTLLYYSARTVLLKIPRTSVECRWETPKYDDLQFPLTCPFPSPNCG